MKASSVQKDRRVLACSLSFLVFVPVLFLLAVREGGQYMISWIDWRVLLAIVASLCTIYVALLLGIIYFLIRHFYKNNPIKDKSLTWMQLTGGFLSLVVILVLFGWFGWLAFADLCDEEQYYHGPCNMHFQFNTRSFLNSNLFLIEDEDGNELSLEAPRAVFVEFKGEEIASSRGNYYKCNSYVYLKYLKNVRWVLDSTMDVE